MYYFWLRVLYCAVWVLNALGDGEILIWSQTIKKKNYFSPLSKKKNYKKTIFFQFFLSRDNILKGQGPKPRSGYKEKAQKPIHPPKMIMIPLPCFFLKKKFPNYFSLINTHNLTTSITKSFTLSHLSLLKFLTLFSHILISLHSLSSINPFQLSKIQHYHASWITTSNFKFQLKLRTQ